MNENFIEKDPYGFYKLNGIDVGFGKDVKLVQFKNYNIGLHRHDFYELNFIMEGMGYHYINDKKISVKKGDVFVVPIGEEHGYREIENLNVTHLIFSEDFFIRYKNLFENNKEYLQLFHLEPELKKIYGIECFLNFNENQLNQVNEWLKDIEYRQTVDESETLEIIDGLTISILFEIFSLYKRSSLSGLQTKKISFISTILDCIFKKYGDELTIEYLADLSGYSRSQFIRVFKKIMNTTPGIFIVKCRVEMAKQYLKNNSLSITRIAQDCGFFDSAHFIRTFKKSTGMTPGAYRKSLT